MRFALTTVPLDVPFGGVGLTLVIRFPSMTTLIPRRSVPFVHVDDGCVQQGERLRGHWDCDGDGRTDEQHCSTRHHCFLIAITHYGTALGPTGQRGCKERRLGTQFPSVRCESPDVKPFAT